MDDREEAIDILTRMSTNHFYGHREQEAFKLGAEALSAPRWTPVTERLPGREGMYLVTSLDGGLHVETTKWFFTTFDGGFFLCDLERNSVIAWMPSPEPYKGGAEE